MKVAIPCWQDRVSPVFDTAANVLLVDCENGRERQREDRPLMRTAAAARARELRELGADVLICGAISAPLESVLSASHVQVIGFVCGSVEEVLAAYLRGGLPDPAFSMPGVRGWRRRFGPGRKALRSCRATSGAVRNRVGSGTTNEGD